MVERRGREGFTVGRKWHLSENGRKLRTSVFSQVNKRINKGSEEKVDEDYSANSRPNKLSTGRLVEKQSLLV